METLIIYYSYSGKTKSFAEKKAKELDVEICEVKEKKTRSKFSAYVFGSFGAMKQMGAEIKPLGVDLTLYEKIVIAGPIWAGFPAPAVNTVISLLPEGKNVEVYFTSGSGKSNGQEKVKEFILQKGCKFEGYHNVKGNEILD